MSPPLAGLNKNTRLGTGGSSGKQGGGASRASTLATCGTEVAHKHTSATTTDDFRASSSSVKIRSKDPGNVKTRDAISYSMARYLAGEERHEKIAQGITSARK